jgi:DKNYY family protein
MPDADAATFELLDRPSFAKDRDHVFQRDRTISDDPAHFELLDGELAKDSHVVYGSDGSVLSDDPTHFAIVSTADNYLYTKDGQTVHVNGNPIPGVDPSTFEVLQGAYARDGRRVYYCDRPIAEADLSSFRPLDGPYARDVTRVYWTDKTIDNADPISFRVLNANFECSADGGRAYYRRTPIADTDPRTFPHDKAVTNCSETSMSFAE